MAVTLTPYASAVQDMTEGNLDLERGSDAFFGVLLTTTANSAINHDDTTVSDVLSGETEATALANYDRVTVASADAITRSSNVITFNLSDVTFSALGTTETLRLALLFSVIGSDEDDDATNIPLCYIDLDSALLSGGDFIIQWNASGVFTITVS